MTNTFQIESAVFIPKINKKGIVKDYNSNTKQYKVTYFSRKGDRRVTKWLDGNTLTNWLPKVKIHAGELVLPEAKVKANKSTSGFDGTVTKIKELQEEQKLLKNSIKLFNSTSPSSFEMVREFQKSFELPAPDTPTILSPETVVNRSGWTAEEIIELLWATSDDAEQFSNMYAELIHRMNKDFAKMLNKPFEPENKMINQIDALIDQKYFVDGSLVEAGTNPDPFTRIVHAANMAKLHDGKVVRNEHGKVVKPEGWQNPEPKMEEELQRQIKSGIKS